MPEQSQVLCHFTYLADVLGISILGTGTVTLAASPLKIGARLCLSIPAQEGQPCTSSLSAEPLIVRLTNRLLSCI